MAMKEAEVERLRALCLLEEGVRALGYGAVCGVDEAGRGPLAGDVYAAAVILPPELVQSRLLPEGLNDSKKVSEKKRDRIFDELCESAVCAVATASVAEIDELNIRNATYLAMNRAIDALKTRADFALVDGDCITNCAIPHQCVIGGDAKSASIAAASILAKVSRDRAMRALALEYPNYGFEKHKGYGTAAHIEALRTYGPCPIHRRTFIKKFV